MATINVREESEEEVTSITFGKDGEYIAKYEDNIIEIIECVNSICIYKSDIDSLINALQKAKELWP